MLLMLEKGIAERIWQSLQIYTKAYDKKKNRYIFNIGM